MWNPNLTTVEETDDESWEVKAFAEDTGNAMGTTWPPRSYTCTFCRREFRSAQALGGHMNVHRRDRARLHQTQVLNMKKNPNLSQQQQQQQQQLVADGGLCLFFSLPNPNADFKPSSLINHNLMDFPGADPHRFKSYLSANSSNNEASVSIDYKKKTKSDLVVEGIDLELRLGSSSSGS